MLEHSDINPLPQDGSEKSHTSLQWLHDRDYMESEVAAMANASLVSDENHVANVVELSRHPGKRFYIGERGVGEDPLDMTALDKLPGTLLPRQVDTIQG